MNVTSSLAGFEVNFMDDVGQTLLNWASAFGTQEMVRRTYQYFYTKCLKTKGTLNAIYRFRIFHLSQLHKVKHSHLYLIRLNFCAREERMSTEGFDLHHFIMQLVLVDRR